MELVITVASVFSIIMRYRINWPGESPSSFSARLKERSGFVVRLAAIYGIEEKHQIKQPFRAKQSKGKPQFYIQVEPRGLHHPP